MLSSGKSLFALSQRRAFSTVTIKLQQPEKYLLEKQTLPTEAKTNKEELM